MTTFQITNRRSGADLGQYEADSAAAALDAMAREAGYAGYAELQSQVPAQSGEIVVREVATALSDEQIAALRAYLVAQGVEPTSVVWSDVYAEAQHQYERRVVAGETPVVVV